MSVQAQIAKGLRKQQRGDLAGAMRHYLSVPERDPRFAHALYFAALGAYELKELDRAIRLMHRVVQLVPKHSDAWYNLGKFYQDKREPETALVHYVAALEQNDGHVEALVNAGNLYAELGDPDTAEVCYHRAFAQDTTRPESIYNRGFIKLARGDYATGWKDFEARWQCTSTRLEHLRDFMRVKPMWDGQPITGRTLLLHAEQGLGDTLQFIRYVPLVRELSRANVILEVQQPLVRLVAESFPDLPVIGRGDELPRFDSQAPLMSLPLRCGTNSLEAIPNRVPYLLPNLERNSIPRRVGIVWAGSVGFLNDHNRSATIEAFAPLFDVPGLEFVSLQVGPRADEANGYPLARIDPTDFYDTAMIVKDLDLVISVDTSTAHLAGALGVRTWLMLPFLAEHRWMKGRIDSPWYPSFTLYRQAKRMDWPGVVARIANDLRAL